ncbi:MAG: zinc dependent phospholipase C family protein [Erysipelotrichaceae bacterium]|jgi:hypothetical protein|nr:zinc dependent phospholipase C family protein [Erysipelotrichaceae bacterium]
MPAATTHVEFAKDLLRIDPVQKSRVSDLPMYYLGSQGPDMLFFSHASVLPGSLHKYGNLMHASHVYEVIRFFEDYAGNDPAMTSYIKGYLCHYALDSAAHPLIFAAADDIVHQHGGNNGAVHVGLEAEIDVWMLHQRGRQIQDYDVCQYLQVSAADLKKLAKMYHAMFHAVFHLDISTSRFMGAIKEVHTWTAFLYPKKSTYDLIFSLENLAGGSHGLSAMMLYQKEPKQIINTEHRSYAIPWSSDETVSASFPALYGHALFTAKHLLQHHDRTDFINNFNGERIL